MRKIRVSNELIYIFAVLVLSFATAMLAAADFGMSMVVAPAYIISLKIPFLTFGQAEYIVQGTLFIVFCIVMRKIKPMYFFSFASGFIYGAVLDFWRAVIPHFNPGHYKPGTLPVNIRIFYFAVGFLLNSLGVALYFKTYFYPQVYEFFVKGISKKFGIELAKFKIGFDMTCLIIAVILSFVLFRKIEGIGAGTVILACCNGVLIGFYGKWMDRHLDTYTKWQNFSKKFELQ
ncbi:MAG: YitT family protein [Lachnospiraceae bacterium]